MSTTATEKTKKLVFCAICTALAVVCSFLRVGSLPFGGSITLFSMFFIVISGYMYGVSAGILTGVVYSILFFFLEPYIYSPIQFILDYPLAFGCLGGVSGIFSHIRGEKIKYAISGYFLQIGYFLGVFCRYICHVISGCIFFTDYTSSVHPVIYSLTYNLTYILPEMILTLLILCLPGTRKIICQIMHI